MFTMGFDYIIFIVCAELISEKKKENTTMNVIYYLTYF